jgi:phosphatidylglycerol:prolipoprotein diacylglycerol transferase
VHKVAFQLGDFPIYWFGILIAAGFFAGLWTAARRAPQAGIPPESVVDLGPWLVGGALVGARALYVISYWDEQFANRPLAEVFMIRQGGMVYYGGFLGATAVAVFYLKFKGIPLWKAGDVLAPSIPLGQAFGRLGCLMNGCCFGRSCELPWAVRYPEDHTTLGSGVHPTPIYESMLCLALSFALAWLHRRKKFDGQVFACYLVGYALLRALVECFRGDYAVRYAGGMLTPAHLMSIGILAVGGILYWRLQPKAA